VWGLQKQKSVDKGRWRRLGWVVEVEVVSESDSLQEAKTVRARTTHHGRGHGGACGCAACAVLGRCPGWSERAARVAGAMQCNAMQSEK
jgi:hypothetical protein